MTVTSSPAQNATLKSTSTNEHLLLKPNGFTEPTVIKDFPVRNNLLGWSLAKIMEANGNKVVKTNIVNDRGIHICKSMLAWLKYGNGETPETSGKKELYEAIVAMYC